MSNAEIWTCLQVNFKLHKAKLYLTSSEFFQFGSRANGACVQSGVQMVYMRDVSHLIGQITWNDPFLKLNHPSLAIIDYELWAGIGRMIDFHTVGKCLEITDYFWK